MTTSQPSPSIQQLRLSQALPPLPSRNTSNLLVSTYIPLYHDQLSEDEDEEDKDVHLAPPGYEPMYDYLRSQHRPTSMSPQQSYSDDPFPSITPINPEHPYQDEPFVVHIYGDADTTQPPPPSYNDIYEQEIRGIMRQFDIDADDNPGNSKEEVLKWIVAMLFIGLTVAGVGLAFNWGTVACQNRGSQC